jgi:hypothetical protein
MKALSSNRELYDYLVSLSAEFINRNATSLSDLVLHASRTAAGNMSTEFLGESRIALKRVLKEENGTLTRQERADMLEVVKQLDEVLDNRSKSRF